MCKNSQHAISSILTYISEICSVISGGGPTRAYGLYTGPASTLENTLTHHTVSQYQWITVHTYEVHNITGSHAVNYHDQDAPYFNPRTTKISTTLELPEASYDCTGLKHTCLVLFLAICVETEVLGVKGTF